jgi:hypothetical protein
MAVYGIYALQSLCISQPPIEVRGAEEGSKHFMDSRLIKMSAMAKLGRKIIPCTSASSQRDGARITGITTRGSPKPAGFPVMQHRLPSLLRI